MPKATREYVDRMAWEATKGIVGHDAATPDGELHDAIREGLRGALDEAYAAGLAATMIQLSFDPGAARVVG